MIAAEARLAEHGLLSEAREPSRRQDPTVWDIFAKHPVARGSSAAGPPGKKGAATKSGRPQGSAPSLIMLRNHPAPPALRYVHGFARVGIRLKRQIRYCGDLVASIL